MRTPEQAIRNFVYFTANFQHDFLEQCWKDEPHLIEHLNSKLLTHREGGFLPVGGIIRFFFDLDAANQAKLATWIDENYNEIKSEATYRYFIFGETASKIYHSESFEEFMKWLENDSEICLHAHSSEETMDDFLSAYDGWMGYAEISETEYEQIEKIG